MLSFLAIAEGMQLVVATDFGAARKKAASVGESPAKNTAEGEAVAAG